MIVFVLSVLFCTSATECRWWKDYNFIIDERECHELGKVYLKADPQILIYRCNIELREWR